MVVIKMMWFVIHVLYSNILQYSKIVPPCVLWRFDHMGSFFRSGNISHECKLSHLFILLFWICGLLSGVLIGYFSVDSAEQLIHFAVCSDSISVLSVLLIRILPVFITIACAYYSRFTFVFLIIFLKSFCFSYVSTLVVLISTSASWLFCLLLMFDEIFILPALIYVWFSAFSNNRARLFQACYVFFFNYFDGFCDRL